MCVVFGRCPLVGFHSLIWSAPSGPLDCLWLLLLFRETQTIQLYSLSVCFFLQTKNTVLFEPTSLEKAAKPFMAGCHTKLSYMSPNLAELRAMFSALTGRQTSTVNTNGKFSCALGTHCTELLRVRIHFKGITIHVLYMCLG